MKLHSAVFYSKNIEILKPWAKSFSVLDPDGNKVEFVKSNNE